MERGAGDIAHYLERSNPPASPLEWLGIAVGRLPDLTARARTADDVASGGRPSAAAARAALLDALAAELGAAAAAVEQARRRLVERHPESTAGDATAEDYADLVEVANRGPGRRSQMMIGAYASFLGGAIGAAGSLADAELAVAGARRWDRATGEQLCETRAAQAHAALCHTLGGLLAYARLLASDVVRLKE